MALFHTVPSLFNKETVMKSTEPIAPKTGEEIRAKTDRKSTALLPQEHQLNKTDICEPPSQNLAASNQASSKLKAQYYWVLSRL